LRERAWENTTSPTFSLFFGTNQQSNIKKSITNFTLLNNPMEYKEFDKKFNKRTSEGIITHTSILDKDGKVLFMGIVKDCEDYWDNNNLYSASCKMTNIGPKYWKEFQHLFQ
jgi:hypothetical protein